MDAVWLHLVVSRCRWATKQLADSGLLSVVDAETITPAFNQTGQAAIHLWPEGPDFIRLGHGTQVGPIDCLQDTKCTLLSIARWSKRETNALYDNQIDDYRQHGVVWRRLLFCCNKWIVYMECFSWCCVCALCSKESSLNVLQVKT
jgi:hypothetical protein